MKRFTTFACLAMVLVFALSSLASELPKYHRALDITVDATDFSKAARDTHYLLGGPSHNADYNGTFQNAAGSAQWNGFTPVDYTASTAVIWHASDHSPINGAYSAWCGEDFGDGIFGYNDGYNEFLEYFFVVGTPSAPTTVDVTATVDHHTEAGYDYSYLTYYKDGGVSEDLWVADNNALGVAVSGSVTYQPGEYVNGNQIKLAWRVTSDGGWCTFDGRWPGDGGLWVDDCTVTITNDGNTFVSFSDFEDGTLGSWAVGFPVSVGLFAKLWTNLEDFDPCLTNYGPQVAFIDDGIVVPGTGGSFCQSWCYGPGGYIVTTTGGLVGPEGHIENAIESPVMAWPNADYDGCYYFFDAYRHEDLSADSPGIFYQWAIRSTASTDPADIESSVWGDRNFVYYGGPDYVRAGDAEVNNLLEPGRLFVQVRASVIEYGYKWSWDLNDGYPAPYFDNFRLLAFPFVGPGFSYRQLELAQDNFPAHGTIDYNDLSTNSVRFDMANTISPPDDLFNNPGDSIVFAIASVRDGATIDNMPMIHYTILANPLFDAYRTTPTTGAVDGDYCWVADSDTTVTPLEGFYCFDLPDEGMLFPGDVLHYYISVEDAIDGAEVQSTTIPRNIDQFGDFSSPLAYHSEFTVHALPSISMDGQVFVTPPVLFWNDFGDRGGEDEWYTSFGNLGLERGVDYDIYFTMAPSSAVSNGIGGRAEVEQLDAYSTLLYTCGDLSMSTISNGDPNNDMGKDAEYIVSWLDLGDKSFFATGDELGTDLFQSGSITLGLAEIWMGINVLGMDVRPSIGGQATPLVRRIGTSDSNPVFKTSESWIAFGGCPGINTFDAIEARTGEGAVRLAEFTSPAGVSGAYSFSAATLKVDDLKNTKVISMPYDFMNIRTAIDSGAKVNAPLPTRATILKDILDFFGVASHPGNATPAPDAIAFSTNNFPNPFNPTTKIEFTMPRAGHLSLKVYNVRGELVRTLVDDVQDAGYGFKMWDGTNDKGANVSSGVYFYEARTDSDVQVHKMALVK